MVPLSPTLVRFTTANATWGTGDLELTVRTLADLEKAKPLLGRSYNET